MTSKERMLIALERGKPDRLPVTIHQWQPYHLNKYMHGISDIEANKACGLDASINFYEVAEPESPDWRVSAKTEQKSGGFIVHYTIETPDGTLTASEGSNAMTTWVIDHLIKKEEDIRLLEKYRPLPKFNRKKAFKIYDELGDGGILRTFIFGKQGGCWQDACELFGVQNLIMATYDNPEWVKSFLNILLKQKLDYIEKNLKQLPFDLVETGGGAASNTVISPSIHEEFCLPYDRAMHDALLSLGYRTVYHTCGGMTKILDLILKNHCEVSETLSPSGVGGDITTDSDARLVYDKLHPNLALIGGMDQFNILETGSAGQIEDEVARLFGLFGKDGGYILSASDHFFEVPPNNLRAFANAAKKWTY
jgi:uroporphyrinogen-III decarboxylase